MITLNSILTDSTLNASLANIDPKRKFKVADFCSNQSSIFLVLEYDKFSNKIIDLDSRVEDSEERLEVKQVIDFSSTMILDIAVSQNNTVLAIDALERTIDGKQFFRDIHLYRKKAILSKKDSKVLQLQQWRSIHDLPVDSNSNINKFSNSAIALNALGTKLYIVYNSTIMVFNSSVPGGNLCEQGLVRGPDINMNTINFKDGFSVSEIHRLFEKAFKK